MKFNYKFQRLCGAYYGYYSSSESKWKGSNLVYNQAGDTLICAVWNRIQVVDLQTATVRTLPVEARSNICQLALSEPLLVAVDVQGYALLVNYHRGIVLHRFRPSSNKQAGTGTAIRCLEFSPSGHYLAIGTGKHVQVWQTPKLLAQSSATTSTTSTFAPLQLHRTYTGLTDVVTCLQWSPDDESVLLAGSRDCTVRLWSLHTTRNFWPVTLQGHKSAVVGAYFGATSQDDDARRIQTLYTISADGAAVTWKCIYNNKTPTATDDDDDDMMDIDQDDEQDEDDDQDEALNFFTGRGAVTAPRRRRPSSLCQDASSSSTTTSAAHHLVHTKQWTVLNRHYLNAQNQQGTSGGGVTVTSTSFAAKHALLAVGFSSGVFGLYELPEFANIHTLSVGGGPNQLVQACTLNASTADWLALACPKSQQLVVWEWRSETYVLKQRGHAYGMRCLAYAPVDGVCVATGGEDGRLKLWNARTGFCYVTFAASDNKKSTSSTHTAPITAVTFANASVVLTASLDGTVKAHDLHRYRTFQTFTTPTPVQFLSLATDAAGEIVVAGSTDPFHIYVWNLQTGKLLDILSGHAGPVCDLAFQPQGSAAGGGGILVSASWDGTVKTWDLYKGINVPMESLQHSTDVVCVAFSPNGQQICTGTIGGLLSFWNVETAKLVLEIDGRRDIAGGRKVNDRMTSYNNAASRYFTSVVYSADGTCVLAGGNSKYVCIYEISQQILLKKFQISHNRSLDGVLDELNSKNLGDGGPIDEEANSGDETTYNALNLPGARRGDDGSRTSKVEVLTMQVSFSPTGREWAIVSGEGLHIYSLDDDMIFDPISLTEAITPAAVESKLAASEYSLALRMAIHLNEFALVKNVLEQTPYKSIPHVVRSVGPEQLERLLQFVAKITADSPHIEFYLQWCLELLQTHGVHMDRHRGSFMRAFRALHKAVATKHSELKTICNENKYALDFIQDHATLLLNEEERKATETSAS